MNVALSTYSPSVDKPVAVTTGHDGGAEVSHMGLRILEIGEPDFDSFTATSIPVRASGAFVAPLGYGGSVSRARKRA